MGNQLAAVFTHEQFEHLDDLLLPVTRQLCGKGKGSERGQSSY
jgi:hypothetical protein